MSLEVVGLVESDVLIIGVHDRSVVRHDCRIEDLNITEYAMRCRKEKIKEEGEKTKQHQSKRGNVEAEDRG